jgi:hypothetical protein
MYNVMILLIRCEHVCLQIKQFTAIKMTHHDNKWKTEFENIFYKGYILITGVNTFLPVLPTFLKRVW